MCGIFGTSSAERFDTLYKLNQDRGAFSFGSVYIRHYTPHNKYPEIGVYKSPGIGEIDKKYADTYHYLTGHTQAPTSSQRDYDKNSTHPFIVDNWIVAHNGVLSNDREIAAKFDLSNVNEVDSSVIPALIQHNESLSEYTGIDEVGAIVETLEEIAGTFACWMINKKTGNIYIARVGSTLFLNPKTGEFSSKMQGGFKTLPEGILYKRNHDTEVFEPITPFKYNSPYLIL